MKDGMRLQDAIRQARIGVEAARKGLGISRSTLFNYYKEDVLEPSVKEKAAELLGKPAQEIFTQGLDNNPKQSKEVSAPSSKRPEEQSSGRQDQISQPDAWKDKYITQLERTAEAERITRMEAQEAKQAEREAKEAYKEIARLKDINSDADAKKREFPKDN